MTAIATAAALLALLLVAAAGRADLLDLVPDDGAADLGDGQAEATQGPGEWAAALALLDVSEFMRPAPMAPDAGGNVAAFLRMIRAAEGTGGPDGYRLMFGGDRITSYADHPRRAAQFTDRAGRVLWTSAAGAFQFMAVSNLPDGRQTRVDTWDRIARRLGLVDFSPSSQDAAAVELIREAGAMGDVQAGRVEDAIYKVRRIWASLPGAGYSQPEKSTPYLLRAFIGAGGQLA